MKNFEKTNFDDRKKIKICGNLDMVYLHCTSFKKTCFYSNNIFEIRTRREWIRRKECEE